MTTCLATLTLDVYYRYIPLYKFGQEEGRGVGPGRINYAKMHTGIPLVGGNQQRGQLLAKCLQFLLQFFIVNGADWRFWPVDLLVVDVPAEIFSVFPSVGVGWRVRMKRVARYLKLLPFSKAAPWVNVAMLVVASVSNAETLPINTGFEPSEGFALGTLQGQNGWQYTGGTINTAVVENSTVSSGTQAVKVTRGGALDTRWAIPLSPIVTPTSSQQIVITWDMNVSASGLSSTGSFGPYFDVEAYGTSGSNTNLFGSLGVDAYTRQILYQQSGTGFLIASGGTLGTGWNNFREVLNFGNKTSGAAYINSVQIVAPQPFVDPAADLVSFTDADISALAAAGDAASLSATGSAYYDNFNVHVESIPTPEPSAIVLGTVGLACLGAWRIRGRKIKV